MPGIGTPVKNPDALLDAACARNVPAELHYESGDEPLVAARVRLLELTERHILADRPTLTTGGAPIPVGRPIQASVHIRGIPYRFNSCIERELRGVRLNARQSVPGIALTRPQAMSVFQQRAHLRISLAGIEPISADLARPDGDMPGACLLDAGQIPAWLLNLSVGGASLLTRRCVLPTVTTGERFYATFSLPCVDDPFYMLATVRHVRTIDKRDLLRLGVRFKPWPGSAFALDQSRISQFVAAYERRMLRRRK